MTIETLPQTDNLQLLIHYTVFSGRLYALVGLEAMVRLYPTLTDPGDATKTEWLPQLDLKKKSRNRVLFYTSNIQSQALYRAVHYAEGLCHAHKHGSNLHDALLYLFHGRFIHCLPVNM